MRQVGKERALQRLSEGDTLSAQSILERINLKKTEDPEVLILLAGLYRKEGTIVGRLKSQHILENGLRRFPDDSRICLELGKTYGEQTFYGDAERCFHFCLSDEATACEAHYCLAANYFRKWKRNQHFIDELEHSAEHFESATQCGPQKIDWLTERAVCCYCLGDTSLSSSLCRKIIERDSTVNTAYFLLGVTAFRHQQFENAHGFFQKALSLLTDEEREVFTGISHLLSTDERIEFEKVSHEEQQKLQRMFWLALDPDPTTSVNERFLEHVGRTFLADLHYSTDRPYLRGWENERGKALIKFGWPSSIHRTLAKFTKNIIDGWAEVWTYDGDHDVFELIFVDEFLNGTFAIPRDPIYTDMAQKLVNASAVSTFEPDVIDIPGAFDLVSFKNNTFSSSVFLATGFDADSIQSALESDKIDEYHVRGVFFDASWNDFERFADTLSGSDLLSSDEAETKWLYAVKEFDLPFSQYHISCALSDPHGTTRSVFKDVVSSSRFLSDSLTLSDILVYRPAKSHQTGSQLKRYGRSFLPNPAHTVREGEKLNVYLEIYNLTRFQSNAEYEVSYMIFEHSEEPIIDSWMLLKKGIKWLTGIEEEVTPFIVQTAARQAYETPSRELMAINIDSLQAGRYLLMVRIYDKYSGEMAESSVLFTKTGGSIRRR